jgi:hypothetical protein
MSPLNPQQVAELCKEANFLACRLSALSVSDKKKKKPFPSISLKDCIRTSSKNVMGNGRLGNKDELGLPRVKLDFTSPETRLDVHVVKKISMTLPSGNLPTSPEGVKLFSAEQSTGDKKITKSGLAKPVSKLGPPTSRRSGLQKPKTGPGRAVSMEVIHLILVLQQLQAVAEDLIAWPHMLSLQGFV